MEVGTRVERTSDRFREENMLIQTLYKGVNSLQ